MYCGSKEGVQEAHPVLYYFYSIVIAVVKSISLYKEARNIAR